MIEREKLNTDENPYRLSESGSWDSLEIRHLFIFFNPFNVMADMDI